jgi:hypothetical protein
LKEEENGRKEEMDGSVLLGLIGKVCEARRVRGVSRDSALRAEYGVVGGMLLMLKL